MADLETNAVNTAEAVETTEENTEVETATETAEIAKLRAEMAKQKAALDKATKEAAEAKKSLRAKQSAEEIAQEESKALQESMKAELEQLRKEKAVAGITAKIVPFFGSNETAAEAAEYLYGAEDADAVINLIQKAWTAKEKALRLEYGKIPAPGVGNADGVQLTKDDIMKIKDPVARQKAISENIQLFMKG